MVQHSLALCPTGFGDSHTVYTTVLIRYHFNLYWVTSRTTSVTSGVKGASDTALEFRCRRVRICYKNGNLRKLFLGVVDNHD